MWRWCLGGGVLWSRWDTRPRVCVCVCFVCVCVCVWTWCVAAARGRGPGRKESSLKNFWLVLECWTLGFDTVCLSVSGGVTQWVSCGMMSHEWE